MTALTVLALAAWGSRPAAVTQVAIDQQIEAAPPADAAGVEKLLSEADQLLAQQRGFMAQPLYERALEGAGRLGLVAAEARARGALAEILYYRRAYPASREQGLKALEIFERLGNQEGIGRTSHTLSVTEEIVGNRDAAITWAERAAAAYESLAPSRGRAVATLQLLDVKPLDAAAHQVLFERAIADARAIGDRDIEATALHDLGDGFFNRSDYERALEALLRAEAVLLETPYLGRLSTVYNSLGRVYRAHGRLDEALRFQLKALDLAQKANAPYEQVQSLNAVATVYARQGDLQSAQTYHERALAMAEKSSSPLVQDFLRGNYASVLIARGEYARAVDVLERIIANGLDNYPGLRHEYLSLAFSKLGRPSEALQAATRAVELCDATRAESNCVGALARRAVARTALADKAGALADVNDALARLEAVRTKLVPLDFFRQEFHRVVEHVYSLAIGLQTGAKQDRLALETAELARSRSFLDLLASRDVRFKEKDREQLVALRANAVTQPRVIELEPPATSQTLPLTLRGRVEPASSPSNGPPRDRMELRSFAAASASSADELMATAARLKSTMVAYWVDDDAVFIWVVSPKDVRVTRVGVLRSRVVELIRSTSPFDAGGTPAAARSIVTRGSNSVPLQGARTEAWRELYDLLIDPVRALLPRDTGSLLTIVPQGPLLNLSFAALRSPRGRYLLEDYALHYAPAGAVLQFTEPKRRADARSGAVLVVADPTLPRVSTLDRALPRLPGARSEAAAISRLLSRDRLTLLQDRAATEASARVSASDKAVLHFATHAIVSDDDPFASYLALGPSGADTGGNTGGNPDVDGRLTAEEVYGLDLAADLVVLSACRSAGGRITGDGISTFARAFFYAGTASLVASLWDVADEPTNRLLPEFYRSWRGGASKSRALRTAQLALLRQLRAGNVRITTPAGLVSIPEHPVFWAGFALFGEPD